MSTSRWFIARVRYDEAESLVLEKVKILGHDYQLEVVVQYKSAVKKKDAHYTTRVNTDDGWLFVDDSSSRKESLPARIRGVYMVLYQRVDESRPEVTRVHSVSTQVEDDDAREGGRRDAASSLSPSRELFRTMLDDNSSARPTTPPPRKTPQKSTLAQDTVHSIKKTFLDISTALSETRRELMEQREKARKARTADPPHPQRQEQEGEVTTDSTIDVLGGLQTSKYGRAVRPPQMYSPSQQDIRKGKGKNMTMNGRDVEGMLNKERRQTATWARAGDAPTRLAGVPGAVGAHASLDKRLPREQSSLNNDNSAVFNSDPDPRRSSSISNSKPAEVETYKDILLKEAVGEHRSSTPPQSGTRVFSQNPQKVLEKIGSWTSRP